VNRFYDDYYKYVLSRKCLEEEMLRRIKVKKKGFGRQRRGFNELSRD
jgi:hypothetical protein